MIVISGALVLVALVLLIIGVVGPDLTFVYASIGVSLVSLVFLVIGILQRRGETGAPAAEPAATPAPAVSDDPADAMTTVLAPQGARTTSRKVTEEAPVAATAGEEPAVGGTVLVVEGRPRYHVEGCRYLSGKQTDEVDVRDAREEGFTPCGVCKPDDALAEDAELDDAEFDDAELDDVEQEDVEQEEVVEEDVPGVKVPTPARTATRAVSKAPAKAAAKAPAKKAAKAAKKAPAKVAAPVAPAAPAPARKAAAKAPTRAATAAAASTPAAASAAKKAGSVVVIPDRGKFHRSECRYVRDVDGAEVLSKSAASRQGYAACGVCKP